MTQQQKQREHPKQAPRNVGERVIAIINLLFGVPLALVLLVAFLREPIPKNIAGWVFGCVSLLIAFGLNGAGICALLRQRRLARTFQWLLLVGVLGYAAMVGLLAWKMGPDSVPLWVIVGTTFVTLTAIALTVLLQSSRRISALCC